MHCYVDALAFDAMDFDEAIRCWGGGGRHALSWLGLGAGLGGWLVVRAWQGCMVVKCCQMHPTQLAYPLLLPPPCPCPVPLQEVPVWLPPAG